MIFINYCRMIDSLEEGAPSASSSCSNVTATVGENIFCKTFENPRSMPLRKRRLSAVEVCAGQTTSAHKRWRLHTNSVWYVLFLDSLLKIGSLFVFLCVAGMNIGVTHVKPTWYILSAPLLFATVCKRHST